jgi:putative holliday junction resolvase
MKILGIDFGLKKIGLALADSEIKIAMPSDIIYYFSKKELIEKIRKIIIEKEVKKIIIGLPLSFDFQETEMSQKVRSFGVMLEKEFSLPIDFQNEMFSSKQVESMEFDAKRKIKSRKPKQFQDVDNQSAALILESYLAGKL